MVFVLSSTCFSLCFIIAFSWRE